MTPSQQDALESVVSVPIRTRYFAVRMINGGHAKNTGTQAEPIAVWDRDALSKQSEGVLRDLREKALHYQEPEGVQLENDSKRAILADDL